MKYEYLWQAEEMLWDRLINTHRQAGRNIPNDLQCEYLNRLVKMSIVQLQANNIATSMERVAHALGTVHPVLHKTTILLSQTQVIKR